MSRPGFTRRREQELIDQYEHQVPKGKKIMYGPETATVIGLASKTTHNKGEPYVTIRLDERDGPHNMRRIKLSRILVDS